MDPFSSSNYDRNRSGNFGMHPDFPYYMDAMYATPRGEGYRRSVTPEERELQKIFASLPESDRKERRTEHSRLKFRAESIGQWVECDIAGRVGKFFGPVVHRYNGESQVKSLLAQVGSELTSSSQALILVGSRGSSNGNSQPKMLIETSNLKESLADLFKSSFKHKGTEESVTLKPKASILAKLGKVFSSELQERCCYIHHYDSAVNQEFESAALKLADFDKNSVPFEMTEKEYHVHCDPVTGLSQLLERTVSSST